MPLLDFLSDMVGKRGIREYQEKLHLFLSDGILTDTEMKALESIAKRYSLTPKDLRRLQAAAIGDVYLMMAEDERITEEEKQALEALVVHFGVSLEKTAFDQKQYLKYYTLALIENGLLPEFTKKERKLPILFREGEVLHWVCPATLRRYAKATDEEETIARGEPYRVGKDKAGSTLKTEDRGSFYLTNERFGFQGRIKQFTMGYGSIHAATVGKNGITIFPKKRQNPYVVALDDYDVPCSILSFIVNQRR